MPLPRLDDNSGSNILLASDTHLACTLGPFLPIWVYKNGRFQRNNPALTYFYLQVEVGSLFGLMIKDEGARMVSKREGSERGALNTAEKTPPSPIQRGSINNTRLFNRYHFHTNTRSVVLSNFGPTLQDRLQFQ